MNHVVFQNISSMAVWGSLFAALMLGVFSVIQAFINHNYGTRRRYLVLGVASISAALVDLAHPVLSTTTYESLRIISWGAYGPSVIWLLGGPARLSATIGAILVSMGLFTTLVIKSPVGTSLVIPTTFLVSAISFGMRWKNSGGYAQAILTATSLSQGLSSILYLPVVITGNPLFIALGYLHFATISVLGVVLGWVHLPLELQGRNHVNVTRKQFLGLIIAIALGEAVTLPSLAYGSAPIHGYLAGSLLQLCALLTAFFINRHELVIFTDNVRKLLAKRTQSLIDAKDRLKEINEQQARILAEQAAELTAKTAAIERQRRLELVADTTGQVAHDIQNIAVPMLRLTATDRDFRFEDLEKLRYHVKELLELNDQLLALSSRRRTKLGPVLVSGAVRAATAWLSDREQQVLELDLDEDLWCNGVEIQLARAIGNLTKNALDAIQMRSGRVSISVKPLTLPEERRCFLGTLSPGQYTVVSVKDNGHGIPLAIRDKIFEPYFSAKGNRRSGAGLGLTIVSSIVRDHHGVVDLTSDEHGTNFEIIIPAAQPPFSRPGPVRQIETVAVLECDTNAHGLIRNWSAVIPIPLRVFSSINELYHAATVEHFGQILVSLKRELPSRAEIGFALRNLAPDSRLKFFSIHPSSNDFISTIDASISSPEELLGLINLTTPSTEELTSYIN